MSVVIPVFDEPEWIVRCVADAEQALNASPFADDAEIVIVDDGSARPTKDALQGLRTDVVTRVITQENQGRFGARETGIRAARGDLVLLLDSRISLAPDSLQFIASRLNGERLPAWNGHVDIDVKGNPFGRFWRTITYLAWRDYLAHPRTTSFGLAEYDRYPKGTGCFIAPREALLRAVDEFRSIYRDLRFSSDDTVLIRSIAEVQPINISPGFSCTYEARDSAGKFMRHAFHRGTTFVDSFGRPGTRFFPIVLAFFPASILFLVLLATRPRLALSVAAGMLLALGGGAAAAGRPPMDAVAFGAVSGPFAVAYSAGIWRGGLLAARAWLGRR
jgi:glycosyltransferase involved in cell wall biosynthesis